ncbi:MAG: AbrB/MazE/SpoVT family DNA-binding domain-containing protein [Caulobacteraceae bacterium]|nr:AbrB/MazE/SpoVT family DNA-binding domain-containing protein [Caulobacteraceae bacterium]
MNARRGRIVSGGRMAAPADMRRALGVSDGDPVVMRIVGGELRLRPARDVLNVIQARLRRYISKDVVLSDELIADRRAAADRE